jgi:hypothetical protein
MPNSGLRKASDLSAFLISIARATVEMLGLCMLGQGVLFLIAGRNRGRNRIYQLFDLITRPPRQLVAKLLPGSASTLAVGVLTFMVLLLFWIGLALARKFV